MNFLNSKILTILLSFLSVWVLFSVISVEVEKEQVKKEEASIEAKTANVIRDNELLEKYIKNFENPEFLEKEARLRFNYKVPGEEVVFVYRDENVPKASSSRDTSPVELPNYKKWWNWLLGF